VKPPTLGVDKVVNDIKEAIFQVAAEGLAQFISHYEGILPVNIFQWPFH
jgi:hypothetical protein